MVPRHGAPDATVHQRAICLAAAALQLSASIPRCMPELAQLIDEEMKRRRPRDDADFLDALEQTKIALLERFAAGGL